MKLKGRLAIITGGGRGIGRAVAFAFAREGANVALAARTKEQVVGVAEEIKNECKFETLALVCDVSNLESVQQAFAGVANRFGRNPDIMVNNAGIAESAPFVKTDDDLWHRNLAINLTGTFYCTRAALPGMLERGWGRIINIAFDRRENRRTLHRGIRGVKARRVGHDAITGARSRRKGLRSTPSVRAMSILK
jgi:NAD(P)-dependent dehydrogenase (short-subunit alcohol dehydrogenase family)